VREPRKNQGLLVGGWADTALVVERTLAWPNRFHRLTIRHERRADIHEAFLYLGCILTELLDFIHLRTFC
jgi:hypothetical protein